MAIGQRLRQERQRTGLNQTDFARIGGVGRNSQTEYETGKTPPNADYLCRIAGAGVDISFVLLGIAATDQLSPDESELVMLIRQLGPGWLEILLSTARRAAEDLGSTAAITVHTPARVYHPRT